MELQILNSAVYQLNIWYKTIQKQDAVWSVSLHMLS